MMKKSDRTKRFSVIIPTYNRLEHLKECLAAVLYQDMPRENYEIIVVSDGNKDGTATFLSSAAQQMGIRYLQLNDRGIATSRNRGSAEARGEILAFVDDDCVVPSTWLRQLERVLKQRRASLVFGNVHNMLEENLWSSVHHDMNQYLLQKLNSNPQRPGFALTCSFACWKHVFQQYRGFDERFYFGSEDREFIARLLASGEVVVFDPTICVEHRHHFSFTSFLQYYFKLGHGSHLLYNVANDKGQLAMTRPRYRDVLHLVFQTGEGDGLFGGMIRILTAFLAQFIIWLGYIDAQWKGVTSFNNERSDQRKSLLSGSP